MVNFSSCQEKNKEEAKADPSISTSKVVKTEEGYQLLVNDEPFYVKGAGISTGSMESLAKYGANSVRTWSADNGKEILDRAQANGLKVMMGLWVALERHGFDYDDEQAVQEQLEKIRQQVMELKDHPALIIWGVGNELNLESKNPKVWDAVNEISKMIHEIDPHHVTTTCLSGIYAKDVKLVTERAPDLDLLSTQMYAAIEVLPQELEKSGYEGPLLVTEWGATGYWEVGSTEWGAPIENNSSVKADSYLRRYEKSILPQKDQVVGSFVFLWGQKQERTPTWFGMFLPDGQETEPVDVMHYLWKGEWPENRTPRLVDFSLNGQKAVDNIKLTASTAHQAFVEIHDYEDDSLTYRWEIMSESTTQKTGGDAEYVPQSFDDLILENKEGNAKFNAPAEAGAYRLFVYVEDGHSHSAHANIPFLVVE